MTGDSRIAAALVLIALLVLSACTGSKQPTSYDDKVEANFVGACTEQGSGEDFCQCSYEGMQETVPFDVFAEFDEVQAEAEDSEQIADEMPPEIRNVINNCSADPSSGGVDPDQAEDGGDTTGSSETTETSEGGGG
ncbi:MAG: hypothetical protein JJLCMIEE_01916 [Acidimicrobiales bacterium]|nr:MAG: hypothetical protein EDR02_10405 [Actinomycetota bacterium]MBV6508850.1 hypothetical protein [Acidimicrobiales bacterium]RIK04976.1 MAG: hypothetical protein DCC48_11535 [Acidobacteriota bacterium]